MKRFLALAALLLGLASCQTEPEGLSVEVAGEVESTITISVADVETRAGLNSSKGVFDNGILDGDATMRYVMKIYDENGKPMDHRYVDYSDDKFMAFNVRLAPNRKYSFVVWADVVTSESDVDNHYNTADLTNVTIIDTEEHPWRAMDESCDAFTGVVEVVDYTSASAINVNLTRPFAKLRVKTTDLADLALLKIYPAKATVTYTSNLRMAFNALEGVARGVAENANTIVKYVEYSTDAYEGEVATLFTDYFFANNDIVHFTMEVKQEDGRRIKFNNFNTDIPAKRNCLTTISGNILTDGTQVSVNIDETDEEKEWPQTMAEKLAFVGIVGGEVTLTENVELSEPVSVNAGVNAVINLNGYSIINTTDSGDYGVGEALISYGNLTIVDESGTGTIQGSTRAVWARGTEGAVVNIYGGIFKGCKEGFANGGCSVIYASSNNTINIYGGRFEALAADKTSYADKVNGVYAALNIQDNKGYINVYGGTFVKFNPENPGTEPVAWNASHPYGFVGDPNPNDDKGCMSKREGDCYSVIECALITDANLPSAFTESVAIRLVDNVTPEKTIDVKAGADVYFDMNGKTIVIDPETLTPNTNGSHYAFIIREGGTLTITGDGSVEATTPAPIMFYPAGDLVIENGTFIRHIPEGYSGSVGSMFVGTKPAGGWGSTGVTIKSGYFDSGYYNDNAAYVEEYMAGTKTLEETEDDVKKRGQAGDKNKTRVALKENVNLMFNKSNNYFRIYGGTFVGANPAWGDEGCMLPTKPNYLRPWSYYQGAFIVGQQFNESGIVLPEGYVITKGVHEDGRPTYTVTYNAQ